MAAAAAWQSLESNFALPPKISLGLIYHLLIEMRQRRRLYLASFSSFSLSLSLSFSLNFPKGLSNLERGKRCRRRRRRRLWRIPLHTSPSFSLSLTYWFQSSFAVLKNLKSLCHLSVIVHSSDTSTAAATAAAASVPWKRRISLCRHTSNKNKKS